MSSESTMKAVACHRTGSAAVMELLDLPLPEVGEGQVLVKNRYAGVNFIDIYLRSGLYPIARFPFVFGKEGSGEAVSVGKGVEGIAVGDRVAFPFGGGGTYCEYSLLKPSELCLIPDTMGFDLAAAAMLQGLTAHYLAYSTFAVQAGQRVLIHAGAGGVGLLLTQICKRLGAEVITTVSTEAKKRKSLEAGADGVIIYENYRFADEFLDFTKGERAHAVYDSVAKETFEQSLSCLRRRGMMVLYGNASGVVPPFQLNRLNELGGLFVTRPSLGHYIADRETLNWRSSELFRLIGEGLKIEIGKVYPLEEASQAHLDLERRKTTGKSILRIA